MINAPRYVRDACAYLINDNLQLHDNNCVMFDMQEISTGSVQFSYWKKGKLQFCKTIKKVQTLFFFFILLEQIVVEELMKGEDILAFHGGCFVHQDNAVLVVQKKGAGKTTLVAKMSSYLDFEYLADDAVICCSETLSIYPLPFPLRLRTKNIKGFDLRGNFLGECVDFNGHTRYLFLPDYWRISKAQLKAVIIPEYVFNEKNEFVCEKLSGVKCVKELIKNIKEIGDMHTFYTGILKVSTQTPLYYCKYSGDIELTAKSINRCLCEAGIF